MRIMLITGTALMLMSGIALAQTSTGTPSKSSTSHMSSRKMKPAMPSGKHTMPTQRRSTMAKTMKKGSGASQ